MADHDGPMRPAITFADVSFAYPAEDEGEETPIFSGLSLELPTGLTFVVGPNGIGKSTLMLLASARLFPQSGEITVLGYPTARYVDSALDPDLEEQRNQLVSFIYQNMEFETDAAIGEVLELVGSNSADPAGASRRYREIVHAAELQERLSARMQELSKGEMQRAIVAMSLLYGSPVVMMDEPVFAVEPVRAEKLFEYLRDACRTEGLSMYASVHDVKLARSFGDNAVLMHADGLIEAGPAGSILDRDRIETAFKAPWDTLYERQTLYRQLLNAEPEE